MSTSLKESAAAAVEALQEWYGADSYVTSTGLYTWDPNSQDAIAAYVPIPSWTIPVLQASGNLAVVADTACWWDGANPLTALIDFMLIAGDRTHLSDTFDGLRWGGLEWRDPAVKSRQ